MDGCGAVRRLTFMNATVDELPRAWLRGCAALQLLRLARLQRLRDVAADALRGASALTILELTRCPVLRRLPARLFAENFNLYKVDLSDDALEELPPDLFGDDSNLSSERAHRAFILPSKVRSHIFRYIYVDLFRLQEIYTFSI